MRLKLFIILLLISLAYFFQQKYIDKIISIYDFMDVNKNNLSKTELIKKKVHVDYHMYMITRMMMKNTYKNSSYIPDSLSFNEYIKIHYGEQLINYLTKSCSNSTYCSTNVANLK